LIPKRACTDHQLPNLHARDVFGDSKLSQFGNTHHAHSIDHRPEVVCLIDATVEAVQWLHGTAYFHTTAIFVFYTPLLANYP
jgi:hypothetical protein